MSRKGSVFVIIIIICLLIISSMFYNNSNKEEVIEEDDIKVVKKEVLDDIKTMTGDSLFTEFYQDGLNRNNISKKLLLEAILVNLDYDGVLNTKDYDNVYERLEVCTNDSYIKLDTLDKNIKNIYGNIKIDYDTSLKDSNYVYDNENKMFYELCINNMDTSSFVETYYTDFNLSNNIATASYAVAFGYEENVDNNKTKVTIYRDYDKKEKFNEYIFDINKPNTFSLDEDNYTAFDIYEIVFEKEDNNYIFKEIKKKQ